MVTFFAIILVLLVVNASLLIFSTTNSKEKAGELTDKITDEKAAEIYPLDLDTSKYKKAI